MSKELEVDGRRVLVVSTNVLTNGDMIRLGPSSLVTASAFNLPEVDPDDPRLKPHHCGTCGFRFRALEGLARRGRR